ncbi:MAG: phosphoribosylglycinamide formyltransferase [Paludibacteraceae bacterium]|jgi:phosphoribosylglycinamide formyltransferase-1|nr:phosphoribosylglycinamide formyltransferase [Paludibacteraceae bacterium]MBP8966472.1 phosphoribosylglycinamide formyltransferase [Paludibacteraceae bacterium]HOF98737.1 phosphoribosylglycinamide formyltransferase [Paludibacteraceae bacterium]HOR39644.1 phosphoribosylglycinamide formyltransferase [Paludibacteraceae bacterium]HPL76551.1 phosphoribosylglycinamide formyltransferase [Paludibacteraceae bacterium]
MSKNIALFASGSGSNAENIIRYFTGNSDFSFPLIISNNEKAFVHERAKKLGVPSLTFPREDFIDGGKILNLLQEKNIDAIVLSGFLLKIPDSIIEAYPQKIVNIHPALLPKFGGKGMYGMKVHRAVLEAGEKETGITIHYVNSNYDEGDIIFQAKCPVLPDDTPESVAQRVHALEYEFFPRIIAEIWK